MKHIVKRGGHTQEYDGRKLYASIYAVMLSGQSSVNSAELAAQAVQKRVEAWLDNKHEVTSNDIRRVAGEALKVVNHNAAYQYLHHRVVW